MPGQGVVMVFVVPQISGVWEGLVGFLRRGVWRLVLFGELWGRFVRLVNLAQEGTWPV